MTRPLRVLVVLPSAAWGGAEALAFSLLEHVDVSVLALAEGEAAERARALGFLVEVVAVGRRPEAVAWGALRLAARLRRRHDVDVVLANGVKAAAVAVPAARLAGVPVVWAKHDYSFDNRLARPLARWSTAVVANSESVAAATGRGDVVVVNPPRPVPPSERGRLVDADRVVACVGRLVPYKGFDTLIEALARSEASAWHAAVVGDDDPTEPGERARLEALAERLGIGDRVHFLGWVPDVGASLGGVDVVAVPTRTDARGRGREGWSMVADDAMAAGVPVVAATGGALTDRLDGAGIAVPPGDPSALAAALDALADPEVRAAYGAAGREQVGRLPSKADASARFVAVLARAANRPGAGAPRLGPSMSVVLPARNEAATAEQSLRAVAAQLRTGDEVIVVHDPSTDDTGKVLDRVADELGEQCRIVHRPPPASGISSARNEGVRLAGNEHIACTDMGCEIAPGWLDALRAAFADDPAPDLVTGLYAVGGDRSLDRAFALSSYPRPAEARRAGPLARAYGRFLGRVYDPTLPTGRSVAFTREAWAAVGGFPEHLATAEDVGFGRMVAADGRRCVLAADAVVTWTPRTDVRETARMYHRYGMGDGESGDRLLVGRNMARLAAYAVGPMALLAGGRLARAGVVAGAAGYLSLPVARAVAERVPLPVYPLLPVALAIKDVAKGVGCVRGLLVHSRP